MGYRGKTVERARARELRAQGWTMPDIATKLGVSRSSVSLWTRGLPVPPRTRRRPPQRRDRRYGAKRPGPNKLARRKQEEIERFQAEGKERIGELSERDFLVAGAALYAGEGTKRNGKVGLANTDPCFIAFFCAWLRYFFQIDESRLRVRLYLHEGLDLDAAVRHWSGVTGIPPDQFGKAYRAVPDAGIRNSKHPLGCATVDYCCVHTYRELMGLVEAVMAGSGWVAGGRAATIEAVDPG